MLHYFYFIIKKQTNKEMNKQELKNEIENLAKEENITFLEACTAMQGAAAKMGSESMIATIHELKMETPEMIALFA